MPPGTGASEAVMLTRTLAKSWAGTFIPAVQVICLLLPGAMPAPSAPVKLPGPDR